VTEKSAHIARGVYKRDKYTTIKIRKRDPWICQCDDEWLTRTRERESEWVCLEWRIRNGDESSYGHGIFAIAVE